MSATAERAAGSFRAWPIVPLVVFDADGDVRRRPELDPRAQRSLDIAVRALRHLHDSLQSAADSSPELEEAHILAVHAMRWLTHSLAPALHGLPVAPPDYEVPVHVYFGVRRQPLSAEQYAAHAATVLFRAVADTRHARIDVNDLCAELDAVATLLARFAPGHGERLAAEAWVPPGARPPYEPAGGAMERWIAVHHAYFLLNVHAAATLDAAVSGLRRGHTGGAELLREAATYVRGFTATMAHAAALPAGYYEESVRPTMQPPTTPFPLTGAMQPEHATYRRSLAGLLDTCPEPFHELADHDDDLARARDDLLEADLADIERHVTVAGTLVGGARSLVQRDESSENAVSTLRRMRDERSAGYAELLRFGGRSARRFYARAGG
jgi:hypothetical protein